MKGIVNELCDRLDHRVLIAEKDPRLRIGKMKEVSIEIIQSKKRYVLPPEDVVFLPTASVSAEELCKYFTTGISKALQDADNIRKIQVRVDEGIGQGAGCELEM